MREVKKIDGLVPVKNAFISVSNKEHIDDLAKSLFSICPGLTIYSSGGTYAFIKKALDENNVANLIEISEYTGQPETDGGLVKTLHHKLFLGYLTETYSEAHQLDLKREDAIPIDLVVVDLYPFSKVITAEGVTPEIARGNIDVGGPSALRAAAKNFLRVMTVPEYNAYDYQTLIYQINHNGGCTDLGMRLNGFKKTFNTLFKYDKDIFYYFNGVMLPKVEKLYDIQ